MMRRFGQHAVLKRECVEEYKRLQKDVWPKVLEMIKSCHIQNYSIFLKGDDLFAYFEYIGNDYDADIKRMEADPITQHWWTYTKPCFATHEKGIYYLEMEEIFHSE